MTTEIRDKPVVRMAPGGLLVRIEKTGVSIKWRRRHKWRFVPYADLAKLALELAPLTPRGYSEREWSDPLGTLKKGK